MKLKRKPGKGFSEKLGIPGEIVSDIPGISTVGFEKLTVENYKSIIQYETEVIRINTSVGIVKIAGEKLDIKWITDEMLEIRGEIFAISRE